MLSRRTKYKPATYNKCVTEPKQQQLWLQNPSVGLCTVKHHAYRAVLLCTVDMSLNSSNGTPARKSSRLLAALL